MILLFVSGFTIGFSGWWLTGYDRLQSVNHFHSDYGTTFSTWSGIVIGLLLCTAYGLHLGLTAIRSANISLKGKLICAAKHLLIMSLLALLAAIAGLITTHSSYNQLAYEGYGEYAHILELHDGHLHTELFTDEVMNSDDLSEFLRRNEQYEATVIKIPRYRFVSSMHGLGMAFIYGLGIAIYLQGTKKGQHVLVT